MTLSDAFICTVAVAAIALLHTAFDDSGEVEKMNALYCENVALWIESGRENGHPNYDNRECN